MYVKKDWERKNYSSSFPVAAAAVAAAVVAAPSFDNIIAVSGQSQLLSLSRSFVEATAVAAAAMHIRGVADTNYENKYIHSFFLAAVTFTAALVTFAAAAAAAAKLSAR